MPSPTSDWDVVDQASFDSFPASDPPAWNSSHASTLSPLDLPAQPRRRARIARAAIAGALAVGGLVLFGLRRRRG